MPCTPLFLSAQSFFNSFFKLYAFILLTSTFSILVVYFEIRPKFGTFATNGNIASSAHDLNRIKLLSLGQVRHADFNRT